MVKLHVPDKHQNGVFGVCCAVQQHPTALYVQCVCCATAANEGMLDVGEQLHAYIKHSHCAKTCHHASFVLADGHSCSSC